MNLPFKMVYFVLKMMNFGRPLLHDLGIGVLGCCYDADMKVRNAIID